MIKIVVHTETIHKAGAKRMFQIRLPQNALALDGVSVTGSKTALTTDLNLSNKNRYCGWLTLQVGEKDNCYADLVPFANAELNVHNPSERVGIDAEKAWWFSGTKSRFFSVGVPIKNKLIEGYYEDHAIGANYPYELKIYLEVDTRS